MLIQTIDGGNTAQLLGMINSGLPLHNTLLQYSPYLSDTVILTVPDPHNNISEGIIKQIH